jgi:alpha/beta superfamily hydrolase
MAAETPVTITAGDVRLEGRLAVPAGATRGAVVCHPHPQYGGTMDDNVVVAVANALRAAGLATLRFNFRGVGASEGRHGGGTAEVGDAQAAVAHLRTASIGDVTLVGYSFGAAVAARAAVDPPATQREPAAPAATGTADALSALVLIAPPLAFFSFAFLAGCTVPKLLVAGEHDDYCPGRALDELVAALAAPKAAHTIAGADHFFLGAEQALAAAVSAFCTANRRA